MSWYYAENNERRGPIEDAAFQALVTAGTIKPETLVWRDGFADWMPYSGAVSVASQLSTSPAGATTGPVSGAVSCSQCGRLFPADETIAYEGKHVCAECKPLFFQKIKEGASVGAEHVPAGFWIRFAAWFVDFVILQIVGQIMVVVMNLAFHGAQEGQILAGLLNLLLWSAYMIFFIGKFGASPGKMACRIEVIRADDSPMTFGRATGRFFAKILSILTLGIGCVMIAFDDDKRALHDRICDTRVVRKP